MNDLAKYLSHRLSSVRYKLECAKECGGSEQDSAEFQLAEILQAIASYECLTGETLSEAP